MYEEIKPCPFCGNQASLISRYDIHDDEVYFCVECERTTCGARTAMWICKEKAIKKWNDRI